MVVGATNRLTAPAYWKFESTSLQQRVNKLSVPEEGYRSGRSTTLRVGIRDNDPAGYDLLVNATAADGAIPFVLRALGLGAAVIDVLDGKSAMDEVSGLCLLQDRRQLRGLEASMWPVCQHADRIRPARGPRAKPSPAIPCLNGDGCC